MAQALDREKKATQIADDTGLSDLFAYLHQEELQHSLVDPKDLPHEERPTVPLPTWLTVDESRPMELHAGGGQKGLWERLFGYNAETDMPWGYERMTEFQRSVYRAQLRAKNMATRMGLAVQHGSKGLLQLALPQSMEEYLVSDKEIKLNRVEEDVYYEKRIRTALEEKQEKEGLTDEEAEELAYLQDIIPHGIQLLPEFVAKVDAFLVESALAAEVFRSVKVPGGSYLSDHLSEAGKRYLGRAMSVTARELADRPVSKIALETLAKAVEQIGPAAGELFTWGVISQETETDVRPLAERLEAGIKMTPWALLPILKVPIVAAEETNLVKPVANALHNAVTKVSATIGPRLAKMQSARAKNVFVKESLKEANALFEKEYGRVLTAKELAETKKILQSVADDVSKVASSSVDDITKALEKAAGKKLSGNPVAHESVIPEALRNVTTAGDDVMNAAASLIEKRTGFVFLRQSDGNYAILDKASLHEVAVDIKRKNLSKELDNLIFGVSSKEPTIVLGSLAKPIKTKRTIVEEVELKRVLKRIQSVSNDAYRAGVADAKEKAAIVLNAARERINTIRADNKVQWQNVEFARQLVKDFVPKEEQHLFTNRLIKAKTEGKLGDILDDIMVHLDKKRVNLAIDTLRSSLSESTAKYSDKSGRFAAAPDYMKPILESLDDISASIKKNTQTLTGTVDDLPSLADDLVVGLNRALSGRGQVLGLPETLVDDLYNLKQYRPGKVSADDIETLSNLARIVLHRAKQAETIKIGGVLAVTSETIDDAVARIIPKNVKPDKGGMWSKIKSLYTEESDHPATLITKMFGADSKAMKLLDDLYDGEVQAYGVMRNSYQLIKEYMSKNGLDEKSFKSLSEKVGIKVGGQSVQITRDDLLGLAMSTRDPWVFQQLTTTRGMDVGGQKLSRMTTDEIADAISKISSQEWTLGSMFFHLNNSYLGNIVNATSLEINGVKLATYPQYYPSHRILDVKTYGNKYAVQTAETQSNFLPRMGGTGKMRVNAFSREIMDYIQNVSMYHGTAVPMRSMKTVFGSSHLQDSLWKTGHSKELSNFLEIVARSEGMYSDSSVIDIIGQKFLNRFTKAVLGGRVSTIGTQMGSVPAAKSIIPGKYFNVSDTITTSQISNDLMGASDMFWYRWTGRKTSIELGDAASQSAMQHFIFGKTPLTEKGLTGMIWGDKQAISKIHLASRRMIADTTKLNGAEAEIAAVRLTEKAVRLTQPNWSPLTRSKLATDASTFKRMFTMFRTAQEAQFNVLKRANAIFSRSPKSVSDWRELGTSYKAVAESMAEVAIWKAVWKWGRRAGVVSVGTWLGVSVLEDDEGLVESVGKSAIRTAADIVPLGRQIENVFEIAISNAFGEGGYVNTASDPISTMTSATADGVKMVSGWIDIWRKANQERAGFTVDLMPTSLDDILNEVVRGEADRKQAKHELKLRLAATITKSAKAAGLVTGVPIAPIDEFIEPFLKRSKFAIVNRISHDNCSEPAYFARDLNKFLTIQAKLQNKSDEKGLSEAEAMLAFNMKIFKKTQIDTYFGLIDIADGNILDASQKALFDFMEINKQAIEEVE